MAFINSKCLEIINSVGISVDEAEKAFSDLSEIQFSKNPWMSEPGVAVPEGDESGILNLPYSYDLTEGNTGEFNEKHPEFTHYCGYCGNFYWPYAVACICCGGRADERILIERQIESNFDIDSMIMNIPKPIIRI